MAVPRRRAWLWTTRCPLIPPVAWRRPRRPIHTNRPTKNAKGKREMMTAPMLVWMPTALITTWWSLRRPASWGSGKAAGIWLEYAWPLDKVPDTAPAGLMTADLMWLDCTWERRVE
jgi:hypothetical protein